MIIKKLTFFISLMFLCSVLCSAAAPAWKLNPEKQFPSEKYVRAIGEGNTEGAAKKAALAELSGYFSQTISSETESYQKIRMAGDNYGTNSDLRESVTVHSDSELFCVRYTDCWSDPKTKKIYVCAYINRSEAWDVITQKMKLLEDKCCKVCNLADKEAEPFKKLVFLNKAKTYYADYCVLYEIALVLFPKRAKSFSAFIRKMDFRMNELMLLKSSTALQVNVSCDKGNSIYTKLSELLQQNGFQISQNGRYKLSAVVNWNESRVNEVYSAYPNIKIVITGNGQTYATFNGECEKVAAYNQESMQRTAISRLEELLDVRFINECFE